MACEKWETVIGLEVHVELSTATKIFCGCTTEFGGEPNTHCCPICMGMPGVLPRLNKKALEYAVKAGLALNCEIARYNRFDRKNYFYPDLPKAYQISQLYFPFAGNGYVEIETDAIKTDAIKTDKNESGGINNDASCRLTKKIRIHEIHMEEDAGKLIHSADTDRTYPDYNRCGVPLIEIVTEPDFGSAEEVIAFLDKLKLILQYLGVSDCKMQEGSLRADVNLSVKKAGAGRLGTRTEMKNINSFKAIARAIECESARQISLLEKGLSICQETRRWDDEKNESYAMRSKEDAMDYRYFPEPDLPPIIISEEYIERLRKEQPELAAEKKLRYMKEFGLSEYDADKLTDRKELADLFEKTVKICNEPKETANWLLVQAMYEMKERSVKIEDLRISPGVFADFIKVITTGRVNKNVGKTIFSHVFAEGETFDVNDFIIKNNLAMTESEDEIVPIIKKVLLSNSSIVNEYKAGKTKVFGFLVGQCMKELRGKANPEIVNRIINEELSRTD